MTRENSILKDGTHEGFPSLDAIRQAHADLLDKRRQEAKSQHFLLEVENFIQMGRETGVLLRPRDDRELAQKMLNAWATFRESSGKDLPDVLLKEFDPLKFPDLEEDNCPYMGLDAFREENTKFFFGRRSGVEAMIKSLKERRMLAVVGPSGSGKSSVVLAGLLPELKHGAIEGSKNWRYFNPMAPGQNPFESLERVLRESNCNAIVGCPDRLDMLSSKPSALREILDSTLDSCVLVVDQFEELFSSCEDNDLRMQFIKSLQCLFKPGDINHTLIITMRSDFDVYLPRFDDFYGEFVRCKIELLPMLPRGLREAIEEPAKLAGLVFEEGVVDSLSRDILGEPSGLPLLQFTLLELWKNRQRNLVTKEAYDRLGGGRKALEKAADKFYIGLFPEDQDRVRYIFIRMVSLGEGLEVTSSRIQRKDLYQSPQDRKTIDPVVNKLIAAKLVRLTKGDVPDNDLLEVAHEALIRNWKRLADWIPAERDRIRHRRRLSLMAEQWESVNRDKSALLRGLLLEEYQHLPDLNAREKEFVRESQSEAESEQMRWKNLAKKAERQARFATARQLAAQSYITQYAQRRLLLSLEALHTTLSKGEKRVAAAEEALCAALANNRGRGLGKYHNDSIAYVLFTSEGLMVTASYDKTIRLWDVNAEIPGSSSKVLTGHDGWVEKLAISPDGRWLMSSSADKTIRLWNLHDQEPSKSSNILFRFPFFIRVIKISPDGRWLFVGTEAPVIYRWDMSHLESGPLLLEGHAWGIRDIAVSANGRWMLSGSDDSTARLWDLGEGIRSTMLGGFKNAIWAVAFTPDDRWLIVAALNGEIRLWNGLVAINQQSQPLELFSPNGLTAMAYSPDSRWLVTGSSDGSVRVWDLASYEREPRILRGHEDWISTALVSLDSRWLITGGADKTVRLWDLSDLGKPPIVVRAHEGCVRLVCVSPDNRWIASCGDDRMVQLLDLTRDTHSIVPRVLKSSRAPIIVSSNLKWIVTAGIDNSILLWETINSDVPRCLRRCERAVRTITISPNERWLAVGTENPQIFLWDMSREPETSPIELPHPTLGIRSIAFTSDGFYMVSSGDDKSIRVWDLASQAPLQKTVLRVDEVASTVAISPDNRWLVAGDMKGTVQIWDFSDLSKQSRVINAHTVAYDLPRENKMFLEFSQNSQWMATAHNKNKDVKIWQRIPSYTKINLRVRNV